MKVRALATYVVPLVLLTAACGGGSDSKADAPASPAFADQSVATIRHDALAAMKDVKSVRMTGMAATEGQPITLDIVMDAEGDCRGSLTYGLSSTQLLAAGGHAWLKPDAAFWMQSLHQDYDSFVASKGRWVEIPPAVAATRASVTSSIFSPGSTTRRAPGTKRRKKEQWTVSTSSG